MTLDPILMTPDPFQLLPHAPPRPCRTGPQRALRGGVRQRNDGGNADEHGEGESCRHNGAGVRREEPRPIGARLPPDAAN